MFYVALPLCARRETPLYSTDTAPSFRGTQMSRVGLGTFFPSFSDTHHRSHLQDHIL